jgi:hypothetical protein
MRKPIILFAIAMGIFIGIWGSLQPLTAKEYPLPEYWRGTTDQRLATIENKIDVMNKKMDSICDDMLGVRLEQAKTGVLYGVFSSVGVYLLGTIVQLLFNRKRNLKE